MQTLKMDFQSQSAPPVVPVMQYDAQSRFIGITLYNGGVPYEAPEGASYTVQYRGPGANNMGWYNTITLSSGTRKAVIVDSASKNVVTLELAEQALRVNGNVFVNLCVVTNTGYMLHTFPIICRVTGAAFPDTVAVQSFFYVTGLTSVQWLAYVTACQDAQRRAEYAAAKLVIDPTLSLSGKAADAAKVGEAVNAESTRAKEVEGELKENISDNLLLFNDYIAGATIELEKNTNGIPIKATFRVDGEIVRTDTMTYFPNDTAIKTIVTKRIISNKAMITITEDTETGKTIVSEIEEYNMIDNGSNYENWVIAGNGTTASANGIHLVADGNIEAANYSFGELVDGKTYKFTYEVVSKTVNSTMVLSAGNFVGSKNVVLDNSIGVHSVNIIYVATSINRLRITLSKDNEDGTYINLCNFKLVEV
jgi:hypothetical protein